MHSIYLTHPEVVIDPSVPMPRWGLSGIGRARIEALVRRDALPRDMRIVASTETKAGETAAIIATALGLPFETGKAFGENDRSSTGYLSPPEFEAHVDALFGNPTESVDGWETAAAAQSRIVAAVAGTLAHNPGGKPILFVGHGCVGTLLKCHVGSRPIARAEDQREMAARGGGNVFVFDFATRRLIADWTAVEEFNRS